MSDIVERLRDACVIDLNYGKSVRLTLDYDDYMEAADEITRLRAEVERLRAALEQIAGYRMKGKSDADIARAALGDTHE